MASKPENVGDFRVGESLVLVAPVLLAGDILHKIGSRVQATDDNIEEMNLKFTSFSRRSDL